MWWKCLQGPTQLDPQKAWSYGTAGGSIPPAPPAHHIALPKQWEGYKGEPTEAMGEHWFDQVWPKVEKIAGYYGTRLNKMGAFSNGESVYAKA